MSVLNDLKKLLHSRFPLFLFFIISFSLFPIVSLPHLPIISNAWAATYYVDATNGNDYYSGLSQSTPWKTIAKVNGSKFNPGDQILFKRGEFWREQLNVSSSGAPENLITFGAYGSGNDPIINGSDKLINWSLSNLKSAANLNIYQTQCNWIPTQVFEDGKHLDFIPWNTDLQNTSALMDTGKWTYDSSKMILYILCSAGNNPSIHSIEAQKRSYSLVGYDKNYIKIQNLVFKMAKIDGLSNVRGSSWIISNCKAYSNYRYGIFMDGGNAKNCLIEECVVWDNNMGIGATNAIDLTIKGCTSHNNNYISDSDGMQFNYVTNLTVERCEIFENNHGGSSDGIQINHTQNATISYNFLHNNGNSSIIFTGSQNSYGKVYYNTIIGGNNGINIYNCGLGNIEIYNNTLYLFKNTGIKVNSVPSPHTLTIKNNIVYGSVALYVNSSVKDNLLLFDYNCYYTTGGTLVNFKGVNYVRDTFSDYQITTKQDRNSFSRDPEFVDISKQDYHLKPTSPCIGAGTDVHLSIDFAGTPIPKGARVDIGAFKHENIAPAPP